MKKYHLLSLLLVMILLTGLLPVQAAALDQPEIISPSAVLLDANTGEVLFEKDGDRSVDPASTAAMGQENTAAAGWMSRSALLFNSSSPAARMSTATMSPARYSYRPWP